MDHEIDPVAGAIDNGIERSKAQLFSEKLNEIRKRCHKSDIGYELKQTEDSTYARVSISAGQGKRTLHIGSLNNADRFLDINFEEYRFISGYEAIYCISKGKIEASVRTSGFTDRINVLSRLRNDVEGMETDETREIVIEPSSGNKNSPTIRVGEPSKEFLVLLRRGIPARLTFSLIGIQARHHDDVARELRSYANSLFFQMDLLYDSTFVLERERRRRVLKKNVAGSGLPNFLEYPRQRFDEAAISLYWYARGARGMPLLQFLAFYQSIEFFFPRFSQIELRKKLATILKNPTFRPDHDDEVDRIISMVRAGRNGGLGDERSQLRAVINQCISAEEMRDFLQDDPDQASPYSGKGGKLRYHRLPLSNKTLDLRDDVASRIYDIRCKIVHTKNDMRDTELEILLPFSDDAELLMHDIDLVHFVSKSVLIAASMSL